MVWGGFPKSSGLLLVQGGPLLRSYNWSCNSYKWICNLQVAILLFNWSFVPNILHIFVPVDKNGVCHRNIHRQRLDDHFHRMHSAFG